MDLLAEIGKKMTETARTITKRSEDIVEMTKLNLAVGNEEDRIKSAFYVIGSELYKDYINGKVQEEYYNSKCIEIKQMEDNIKTIKEKILLLKGRKPCKSCGCIVDLGINFCPNCGSKLEKS